MAALAATEEKANGKVMEEPLRIFRDTTGPMKSQRHVFEATTSIGRFTEILVLLDLLGCALILRGNTDFC